MKLLYGHAEEVIAWTAWRIPQTRARLEIDPTIRPFGAAYAIGVLDKDNQLVAGVVFHSWAQDYQSIEISFAASTPKWATHGVLRELMAYAYETAGCNRVQVVVAKDNRPSRKFVERYGFRREGVATDGFGPGVDAILYRMLKREWLQSKWGEARVAEKTDA